MALHRRPSFGLKETVSIRHFFASTRGRTAKPAHYSIPTTASDSLIFLPRHRPLQTVLTSPHSLAKLDLKQALFATSALPSLPLTITGVVELGFTKRILKIWLGLEPLPPLDAMLAANLHSLFTWRRGCVYTTITMDIASLVLNSRHRTWVYHPFRAVIRRWPLGQCLPGGPFLLAIQRSEIEFVNGVVGNM
jgi:hypothetical protein